MPRRWKPRNRWIKWKQKTVRAERGEVWQIDFGIAAKIRPALLLTGEPEDDELDLFTVLLHTTALRGNRWELEIRKPFLKEGAFHFQQVQSISGAKLMRRLGVLTGDEMSRVDDALRERLCL
jgi:mRNA interferase MazF